MISFLRSLSCNNICMQCLPMQDVLLYNFFSTSPFEKHWRVIYGYMEKHCVSDPSKPISFPSFYEGKHHILCSELKQLYVAITRTRQRLWICETGAKFCHPIFDYWKSLFLVQERCLDHSFAQDMCRTSSLEEWSSRGIKVCFHLSSSFLSSLHKGFDSLTNLLYIVYCLIDD